MSETLLGAPNSRERKVRKFLSKPPAGAAKLLMLARDEDDDDHAIIGEWDREDCVPILADTILDALDEHAKEMGGVVKALLTYRNKDGDQVGAVLPLQRQASHLDSEEGKRTVMGGGERSVVVVATAQSLQVQRLYMQGLAGLIERYDRQSERDEERADRLYRRVAELELENSQLKEALSALEALVQNPEAAGTQSPGQERALKLIEQIAPVLLAKLMSPGAPS